MPSSVLSRLTPITSEIGFLEIGVIDSATTFAAWMGKLEKERGGLLRQESVSSDLETTIRRLLPLTNVDTRRWLFIPTKGPWTVYLNNGHTGSDNSSLSHLARLCKCRAVRAAAIAHTFCRKTKTGQFGATIFELYGNTMADGHNSLRGISATHDEYKWSFHADGAPLPFEDVSRYEKRAIAERFPKDLLRDYLRNLDIDMFSDDFYASEKGAVLFERTSTQYRSVQEYSLNEAQLNAGVTIK